MHRSFFQHLKIAMIITLVLLNLTIIANEIKPDLRRMISPMTICLERLLVVHAPYIHYVKVYTFFPVVGVCVCGGGEVWFVIAKN